MSINRIKESAMINVLMLGASGVGKSSMIAAMYDEMRRNASLDVHLKCATPGLQKQLQSKLDAMKNASGTINNKEGIEGTSGKTSYEFNLSASVSEKSKLGIRFTDIPGGWVEDDNKEADLQNELCNSHIIMLPIHAPAMMEQEGFNHKKINKPDEIQWFLSEQIFQRQVLILLAPVKCESYMLKQRTLLLQRIQEVYEPLISGMKNNPHVALAITPIETMGNMRFESWKGEQDYYYRVGRQAYAPRFVEQPLCYALSFSLNMYLNYQRSIYRRCLDGLPFISLDKDLKKATERLAGKIKTRDNGFQLIQGDHLLRGVRS